jgi:hypothetical protein
VTGRVSKDWKVKPLVFPGIGKTHGKFSKAWMARGAPQDFSGGFFQALEKANQNNHGSHRSHGRKRFSVVRVIRG